MDGSEYKVNLGCELFRLIHYSFQSSYKIFQGFDMTLLQQKFVQNIIERFLV